MSRSIDDFLQTFAGVDFNVLCRQFEEPTRTRPRSRSPSGRAHCSRGSNDADVSSPRTPLDDIEPSQAAQILSEVAANLAQQSPSDEVAQTQAASNLTQQTSTAEDEQPMPADTVKVKQLEEQVRKLRNWNRGGRNKIYYEVLRRLGPQAAAPFWVPAPVQQAASSSVSSQVRADAVAPTVPEPAVASQCAGIPSPPASIYPSAQAWTTASRTSSEASTWTWSQQDWNADQWAEYHWGQ